MTVHFNHTFVLASDPAASSKFFAEVLGLGPVRRSQGFWAVQFDNDVMLEFMPTAEEVVSQHLAFLVSEQDFDAIFTRVQERSLPYWSGPLHSGPSMINRWQGGRGVYFDDPDGHSLELLTRHYRVS